jgi:hypothetical protein
VSLQRKEKQQVVLRLLKIPKGGAVTGHYFNFIAGTLDILDQHE